MRVTYRVTIRPTSRSVTAKHRKKKFRRRMNRRDFMKRNENQSISQASGDRKMLKAERNASLPRVDALSAWFRLLGKFPSPVIFAIPLGGENFSYYGEHLVENLSH